MLASFCFLKKKRFYFDQYGWLIQCSSGGEKGSKVHKAVFKLISVSNVILLLVGQLFLQRQSFFKLATIRCTKDSRASYCLACLISLVEQVIGLL